MADRDDEGTVTRVLLDPEEVEFDGPTLTVRESKAAVERRGLILRDCALLQRALVESYERKLPPLEFRSYPDLDAHARYAQRVAMLIGKMVCHLDAYAPGGCLRDWHRIADEVRALSFEDVMVELMRLPIAP